MNEPVAASARKSLKQNRLYFFGPFRLEPEERTLFCGEQRITLAGKAFDILVILVENHGHLVRRDQIVRKIWPDSHVSEGNLDVHLTKVRSVLGDGYIESIARQGYRFIPEVTEAADGSNASQGSPRRSSLWTFLLWTLLTIAALGGIGAWWLFRSRKSVSPQSWSATLYRRALEYERSGDDEQALAALDQALAASPNDYDACIRAAYLAYELEEIPRANEYLRRCKAADAPVEALRLKAQGLSYALNDDPNRALELYQLLIDSYPSDTDGLYRFAEVATNYDRLHEADNAAGSCIRIEPLNPYCRFQLMYIRIKQNRFDDVLADYKTLPEDIKSYPWFEEPVGVALLGEGHLEEAADRFEKLAILQNRLHGTSHFTTAKEWLADLLLYRGHIVEARHRIEQLMETSDNSTARASYLSYLAKIYLLLGKNEEARAFAVETADAPPDVGSLVGAAEVLAAVGDTNSVKHMLDVRAKVVMGGLSPGEDHFIRGMLAYGRSDFETSLGELRLAQGLNPRDGELTYWIGLAYARKGDYHSALPAFERIRELKGTILLDQVPFLLPLAAFREGECYEKMGDSARAKEFYAEASKAWGGADDYLERRNKTLSLR